MKKQLMQFNISLKLNLMIESFELIGILDISKEEKKEEDQEDNKEEMILEPKKIMKDQEKNHNMTIVIETETVMKDINGVNAIVLDNEIMEIENMREKGQNKEVAENENMMIELDLKRSMKRTIDFYIAV